MHMIDPDSLYQLARDRQRERIAEADAYRLAKQAPSRRHRGSGPAEAVRRLGWRIRGDAAPPVAPAASSSPPALVSAPFEPDQPDKRRNHPSIDIVHDTEHANAVAR